MTNLSEQLRSLPKKSNSERGIDTNRKKHSQETGLQTWLHHLNINGKKILSQEEELSLGEKIATYRKLLEQEGSIALGEIEIPERTPLQEIEILKQKEEGEKAIRELANANIKFLKLEALRLYEYFKHMDSAGIISKGDAINAGYEGLMEAAKRFDHTRGMKFITYAKYWIYQSINFFFYEHGSTIRKPYNLQSNIFCVSKAYRLLLERNHYKPKPEDLVNFFKTKEAKELKLTPKGRAQFNLKTIQILLEIVQSGIVSLDTPISHGSDTTRKELVPTDDLRTEETIGIELIEYLSEFFEKRLEYFKKHSYHGAPLTEKVLRNTEFIKKREERAYLEEYIFSLCLDVATKHYPKPNKKYTNVEVGNLIKETKDEYSKLNKLPTTGEAVRLIVIRLKKELQRKFNKISKI